jgi:hypothetical protein
MLRAAIAFLLSVLLPSVALAQKRVALVIDASSNKLRACARCGRKGATLQHPSWGRREIGWSPFPVRLYLISRSA